MVSRFRRPNDDTRTLPVHVRPLQRQRLAGDAKAAVPRQGDDQPKLRAGNGVQQLLDIGRRNENTALGVAGNRKAANVVEGIRFDELPPNGRRHELASVSRPLVRRRLRSPFEQFRAEGVGVLGGDLVESRFRTEVVEHPPFRLP